MDAWRDREGSLANAEFEDGKLEEGYRRGVVSCHLMSGSSVLIIAVESKYFPLDLIHVCRYAANHSITVM